MLTYRSTFRFGARENFAESRAWRAGRVMLTGEHARRSRLWAVFSLRSDAHVQEYVPLRCSRKLRRKPSLAGGASMKRAIECVLMWLQEPLGLSGRPRWGRVGL